MKQGNPNIIKRQTQNAIGMLIFSVLPIGTLAIPVTVTKIIARQQNQTLPRNASANVIAGAFLMAYPGLVQKAKSTLNSIYKPFVMP